MTYENQPPASKSFDVRSLDPLDQAVLGLGAITFILSLFLPWYGAKIKGSAGFGGSASSSITAWHSYDVLALLLLLAATVLAAARVFAGPSLPRIAVGYRWVIAGLASLGALLYVLRTFTLKTGGDAFFSYGRKWGAYVLLILILATAVAAVMNALRSDEAKPWDRGATGGGAPAAGGWNAPPAPGATPAAPPAPPTVPPTAPPPPPTV